ncbi:hypothetical protein [Streptomyces canus]|uniref:hypothetical protein n=1 Tax=Streptomyces canus TaxID=58343 RepID=UPI002E37DBFD|nr:hypothetical protein [Streptomyces canus]
MLSKERQRERAAQRVEPGNGQPVKTFRWWQPISRSSHHLRLAEAAYAVDVSHLHQFTSDDGTEEQLLPAPASAEGRRARLSSEHPALSRLIGIGSLLMVVIPLLLLVPQLAEAASRVPQLAKRFGTFTSPIDLPRWLNTALGVAAGSASVERGSRMR